MKKILLLNVLILFGLLSILEVFWGNWFVKKNINQLNLRKNIHWHYDVKHLYDSSGPVSYSRDGYGLRGKYENLKEVKILSVGGSTTEQPFIDDARTWQEDLADCLSVKSPKRVSVINAGINGQSSYGHLENFHLWFPDIPDLKPRVILVYIGINDESLAGSAHESQGISDSQIASSFSEVFRNKSALFNLARIILGNIRSYKHRLWHQKVDFEKEVWTQKGNIADFEFFQKGLLLYRNNLREVVKEVRAMNAEPIFITQSKRSYKPGKDNSILGVATEMIRTSYKGHNISGNGVDQAQTMKLINAATLAECERSGVFCIDAAAKVNWEDADFYDYTHLNPTGTQKLASMLCKSLRPHLAADFWDDKIK